MGKRTKYSTTGNTKYATVIVACIEERLRKVGLVEGGQGRIQGRNV